MGKSNRIRTQRAEMAAKAPQTANKKSAPSWLYSVIALVVVIGVILGTAVTLLTSNGVIFRNQKAVKSENYAIPGTVLQYMFYEQYSSFVSSYESYLSIYGLDTSLALKDQKYTLDDSAENTIDTWYDYFMTQTLEQARQILIYCEEADKRGIKLDESDLSSIDASLEQLEFTVTYYNLLGYNFTLDSYISSMYGEGIKEKDIRTYLKLYTLATKCVSVIGEELKNAITADRINAEYDANAQKYDVVDYDVFSKKVSFSDIQKELYPDAASLNEEQSAAVLAEYEKRVLAAVELQEKFAKAENIEVFEKTLLDNAGLDAFDAAYKTEALADADKLTDDDLNTIRNSVVSGAIDDVKNGLAAPTIDTSESDGEFTAYGVTVTENAAKALDNIKKSVFNAVKSAKTSFVLENVSYSETNDVIKWAFEAETANSVKSDITGDEPVDGKVENSKGYYQANIYMLKTPAHRDETLSKNTPYMTFSTEDAAKKAIELLDAFDTVDRTTFDSVAATASATNTGVFEEYTGGSYTSLDEWLFDEENKAGSYTTTPILLSSSEDSKLYGVFFYEADSDAAWYLTVKEAIYSADADATYAALVESYPVTINDKVTNKVSN